MQNKYVIILYLLRVAHVPLDHVVVPVVGGEEAQAAELAGQQLPNPVQLLDEVLIIVTVPRSSWI